MDQLPRSNEGFANSNLYADSQQYNAYDNLFHPGADQNSYDASWGVNASNYPVQSRAQHQPAPSWPQNANQLSAPPTQATINGRASPYARSLSHSPAAYGQNGFNGYGAPQNFQYRQPQYDPSLVSPHAFNQNFNYPLTDYQTPNAGTIAPHALQHEPRPQSLAPSPYDTAPYQVSNFGPPRANRPFVPDFVDQSRLISAIPVGQNGGRFSIINFDELSRATNSERMGNFLNVGVEAHNWDVNRAALPAYVPRRSRNELRKSAKDDPKLLAKLGKKTMKKERAFAAVPKPAQTTAKGPMSAAEKIKYENDVSSESSSSESEDESSYTSEDEGVSPLPTKRPDQPKEGTEYDTIKALWRGKRKKLDSATIRKGLGEFWEVVKTIRDRWKLDVTALQDAESKGRKNELPLLESRVKDQRDMLEAAFKAALKHGHRAILELMSENMSLLFLCYQFLLDRFKVEDYNGSLPRAILETISLFSTMTNEKLEKTHLVKVLPRFTKKGDAKTQFYAKRITANAASGSKDAPVEDSTKKAVAKDGSAASPTSKRADPEPIAGVKRAASTATEGGAQKKLAVAAAKSNGVSTALKASATAKKPASMADTTKLTTAAAAPAAKPKQVVAKPSGLFSSLQSAAKKPGTSVTNKAANPTTSTTGPKPADKSSTGPQQTNQNAAPASTFSFAETMANLSKTKEDKPAVKVEKQAPTETAEEKKKRLRKESRRHLHVKFKTGDDLVQVHEFHHDPEEELGHDASQVRDLADVGGEGRMFKQQHQMMDIDDEEESAEEDDKLVSFSAPDTIDFSVVDIEERKRNYAPYGGGKLGPESDERSVREKYEADTLIVSYIDTNDIPPNPREPSDPYNGLAVDNIKKFGMPEEKWVARARQSKPHSPQYQKTPQPAIHNNPAPAFDLSKLAGFANNPQMPPTNQYQAAPQPAAPTNDAINNILASLKQAQPNAATPPFPMMTGYGSAPAAPPPNMTAFPPQQPTQAPAGQPDLAAILAQIQQAQPTGPPQPPMGGFGFNPAGAVPNMTAYPPQAQPSGIYENPERKQWRDGGGDNKTRKKNPGENPYFRTKVCKYWQEGRCQKGDQCSYKHSES